MNARTTHSDEHESKHLAGRRAVVVGASRGLGLGITRALQHDGASVVAVARTEVPEVEEGGRAPVVRVVADARDEALPGKIFAEHEPDTVIIVAGAVPHMVPLHEQTWETFSLAWETDVRITFEWVRQSLVSPLAPGSSVIVFSSGAALGGSPLSGGYAGGKATQRFITDYARRESAKAGLGIGFTSIMSKFAPETGVGAPAVAAYAAESGLEIDEFLAHHQPLLTPEIAGTAVSGLVSARAASLESAYLLTGDGVRPLTR